MKLRKHYCAIDTQLTFEKRQLRLPIGRVPSWLSIQEVNLQEYRSLGRVLEVGTDVSAQYPLGM